MWPITIRARGHENIRARHHKTIELTSDADLTSRGTCVVAVAAELDPARLRGLTGPVILTLTADGRRDTVRGVANPRYDAATGRAVIRCSRHRAPDTLVFAADKSSADLDRGLVAALARPEVEVRVTIEPDEHSTVDGSTDDVVDVDLIAVQTILQRVATTLVGEPHAVTVAGALPRRASERRRALATAPASVTIWQVRPQDVAAVTDEVGERLVAVVTDAGTPNERVEREAARVDRRASTAFVAVRDDVDRGAVDDRLLAALLDGGVAARTVGDALSAATGSSRREAYERVVRARTTR